MNNKLFLGIIFAFAFLKCVKADTTVIGGEDTDIEDYPFIVSLYEKNGTYFKCGGSIIRADWILTAAHCVKDKLNDIKIRVGSSKLLEGNLVDVDRIVMHELDKDIAMLQIKNKLEFSEKVQPIKLAEADAPIPPDGSDVFVLGWGVFQIGGLRVSNTLQSTTLQYLDLDKCKKAYPLSTKIHDPVFCLNCYYICVCHGDSGGPAIYEEYLIGITSWAYKCMYPKHPAVFVNVAQYRIWIDNVMETQS